MEKFDKIFKENIGELESLQELASWDIYKNWDEFSKDRFRSKGRSFSIIKYAAVAVILTAFVFTLIYKSGQESYTEISTGKGEKTKIKLGNSCEIWLNANTTIKYPSKYTEKTMMIEVEGEAYFEIEEKRKNPIVIIAGSTSSYITESAFNIRAFPLESNIEITATKGNVQVGLNRTDYSQSLIFSEGERVSVHKSNYLVLQEDNPDFNVLAWKTGVLEFRETPLVYIVQKLELLFDTKIEINEKELKSIIVNIKTEINDLNAILEYISKMVDCDLRKNGDGYILSLKSEETNV